MASTAAELAELGGLAAAKRCLARWAAGDATHAVLLYGSPGAGADELASILAKAWLCSDPAPDGACGECQACRAADCRENADWIEVKPTGPSRQIVLSSLIEVEEPKRPEIDHPPVSRFLVTLPLLSRHKVVVVRAAERLNPFAANSLLKMLEETPAHAKFILVTTAVGSLPPTIVSRCVSVPCEAPPHPQGATPGEMEWDERHPDAVAAIRSAAQLAGKSQWALRASDDVRGAADLIEEAGGLGAREAQAKALERLGREFSLVGSGRWNARVAETHRRVEGNGSFALNVDALFAGLANEGGT